MSLSPYPNDQIGKVVGSNLVTMSKEFQAWIAQNWMYVQALGGYDVSTNRPTKNLYNGMMFFDSTLGKPIFLKSQNPSVWVDATGNPV